MHVTDLLSELHNMLLCPTLLSLSAAPGRGRLGARHIETCLHVTRLQVPRHQACRPRQTAAPAAAPAPAPATATATRFGFKIGRHKRFDVESPYVRVTVHAVPYAIEPYPVDERDRCGTVRVQVRTQV